MKKVIISLVTIFAISISFTTRVYANIAPPYDFSDLYKSEYIIVFILLNILIEIIVYLSFFKKLKIGILKIAIANILSYPIFYWLLIKIRLMSLSFILYNPLLLILEIIVFIFEALFIKIFTKEIKFSKLLHYSLIANIFSFIVGQIIFNKMIDQFWEESFMNIIDR